MMRRLTVAALAGLASCGAAYAADPPDLPILRGSFRETPVVYRTNWQGFYIGGQGTYSWADMDFVKTNNNLASSLFSNSSIDELYTLPPWFVMGNRSDKGAGFGAFAGYNWQWEDAVVGIDFSYTRGALSGADGGSRSSEPPYAFGGYTYTVTNLTTAALNLNDYGSIRLRGGYSMGNFMPYAFVGLALARADVDRDVAVVVTVVPSVVPPPVAPPSPPPVTVGTGSHLKSQVLTGLAVGIGAEYMLMGGLFARAEWEHMRFDSVVNVGIHTVRGGIGYKF